MTKQYTPELGQMFFGCPTGAFDVPGYADALIRDLIYSDINTVYWNINQKPWEEEGYSDPKIPGVEFRRYWWGADDAPECELPNFAFNGIEVRWYKHPGRGMSCNVEQTAEQWAQWYEAAHNAIWAATPKRGG